MTRLSRMCRALMPGDEESMTDEAIWETLPVRVTMKCCLVLVFSYLQQSVGIVFLMCSLTISSCVIVDLTESYYSIPADSLESTALGADCEAFIHDKVV